MKKLLVDSEPVRLAILVSLGLAGCSGRVEGDLGGKVLTETSPASPALPECENDQPVFAKGVENGLFQCSNGIVHRPAPVTCEAGTPTQATEDTPAPDPESGNACHVDAHCTERPYGMCRLPGPVDGSRCEYGCLSDGDCESGNVCVCSKPYGRCVAAACTSDADCEGEALCARALGGEPVCGAYFKFACQSLEDECHFSEDCNGGESEPNYCSVETGLRRCHPPSNATCGRPFVVDSCQRQAEAVPNAEWRLREPLVPAAIDEELRLLLAEGWTRAALMEHASIAAFARFSLQLMALGAPADLIESSTQAMQDETLHARLCFELASQYAGRSIGPGPLDTRGALDNSTLIDVVLLAIEEGCIGETVAALEATEAAAHCQDEAVHSVLATIKEDELRHSTLAWRFVSWALQQGDASLRRAVEARFQTLHAEARTLEPRTLTALDENLLTHGIATRAVSQTVRARALREVVLRCAEALLGTALVPEGLSTQSVPGDSSVA